MPENKELTCATCGHTGQDVHITGGWAGGWYKEEPACGDRFACWQRWDKKQDRIPMPRYGGVR